MSERTWARRKILEDPGFREVSKDLLDLIEGARAALVGGLAVAWHANPPVTPDVDFLTDLPYETLFERAKKFGERKSWKVFPLRFAHRQKGLPSRGVGFEKVFPHAEADILVAGEDPFLTSILDRAVLSEIQPDFKVPVATAEDLYVMKTILGRDKDLEDTIMLEQKLGARLDRGYIDKKLQDLGF